MKMIFRSKNILLSLVFMLFWQMSFAKFIYISMDEHQSNHLKAYGIVFKALQQHIKVKWLLNYEGGSFLIPFDQSIKEECQIRSVSFQIISEDDALQILKNIASPSQNQEAVVLEKAPKIAVYSPKDNMPWDDAVTMVLTYAEIPYDVVYDEEVLDDKLLEYDWLHLHHEDFTGQYGRFYAAFRTAPWYIERKQYLEKLAKKLGYAKVSQLKLAVAKKISDYVVGGGFMFAMCSATDSFDIALAADGVDIAEAMYDGDPSEPAYQSKLDYSKTLAFTNFTLEQNPMVYEFSDIDTTRKRKIPKETDYFELNEFSAKWDPVPTMLTQNHTMLIKGFMGQTTAYDNKLIKPNIIILAQNRMNSEARYIHGVKGKGMFTYYGGHDPEDYSHRVGDPKTELDLHPNSPGYRLILNNVLFPAAKKKKKKT
jgi:hypothetical protein